MQINFIPQTPAQWFGFTVATILAAIVGWFTRRKREPVELAKIRAETRSIHISADLDVLRELQNVTEKAEKRREESLLKEDQMRNQILFWRNKSEEFDGKLADAQETIWKMQSEMKTYEMQLTQMKAALVLADTNYDNTKNKKVEPLPETPKGNGR